MADKLPQEVVAEDQRLDAEKRAATGALMQLRWHWTRNADNPKRVSAEQYAKDVGKAPSAIKADANGWQMKLDAHRHDVVTMEDGEYRELAKVGEIKRQAAQAIAEAEGIRVDNVLSHRRDAVRDVVATATDAAERRGTTVEHEIKRKAEQQAKAKKAAKNAEAARKAKATARYLEVEGDVAAAKRRLTHALDVAKDVDFDDEERDLIIQALASLRALINLIDLRIAGTPDIDWDAEFAKIGDAK